MGFEPEIKRLPAPRLRPPGHEIKRRAPPAGRGAAGRVSAVSRSVSHIPCCQCGGAVPSPSRPRRELRRPSAAPRAGRDRRVGSATALARPGLPSRTRRPTDQGCRGGRAAASMGAGIPLPSRGSASAASGARGSGPAAAGARSRGSSACGCPREGGARLAPPETRCFKLTGPRLARACTWAPQKEVFFTISVNKGRRPLAELTQQWGDGIPLGGRHTIARVQVAHRSWVSGE